MSTVNGDVAKGLVERIIKDVTQLVLVLRVALPWSWQPWHRAQRSGIQLGAGSFRCVLFHRHQSAYYVLEECGLVVLGPPCRPPALLGSVGGTAKEDRAGTAAPAPAAPCSAVCVVSPRSVCLTAT